MCISFFLEVFKNMSINSRGGLSVFNVTNTVSAAPTSVNLEMKIEDRFWTFCLYSNRALQRAYLFISSF